MCACYIPCSVSDTVGDEQSTELTTSFSHGLYILLGCLDDKQIHNVIRHIAMNMVNKRNQGKGLKEKVVRKISLRRHMSRDPKDMKK